MADKSGRAALSDRGIEQAIVALKKGAHLLKCGRRGKPKFCPFRLSMDEKVLIWYSGEKEKHLKLNSVSKIVLGQKTVNFLRQSHPENESRSFSLIYQNGARSLDLICKDKEQAESWFLGLTALVSVSHHPQPIASLKISRGAHSCANSPVSHIQRKHKLGLLQDSVKLTQVRSLYGSPPRSLLGRHFPDSVSDSCDVFYSSRERNLSDMQPLWDRMLPRFSHIVSDSCKDRRDSNIIEEHRTILTTKITSDHGTSAMDKTDALKDVFMWGEGIGEMLSGGFNRCEAKGTKVDALLPRLLESTRMVDAQFISCGEKHTALVTKQGEVFCWGKENGGRLGHKVNMDVPCPKVVESLSRVCVQTIACGTQHTCAVTSSGELYAWGDGSHGVSLSGDGRNGSQWFPHKISGPLDGIWISRVACGEWHTAVVSSSGQLFTYGDGTFGVLGHGNLQSVSEPKEVESLKGLRVKSVACGPWHTAAIVEIRLGQFKSNAPCGKLFTWGDSDRGRLGHADSERKLLPTCVASLVDCDFIQVSCGRILTVALTVSGVVFTMGSSVNGQLGNPQAEDTSITPVEGFLKREFVKEISSGSFHVAVLTTKGRVYTWGKGANGRLGLGDTNDRDSPALVETLDDRHVKSVVCGSGFTAVICSHKPISSKDQSICSGCGAVFGFTRKKHNCYNCASAFCHSCSSNKAANASLAPNKSKNSRVCDTCFAQLENPRINKGVASPGQPLVTRKGVSDLKVKMEVSNTRKKNFPPKVSTHEIIKLVEGSNHLYQDSYSSILGTTQRWGQVPRPLQFNECTSESSLMFGSQSKQVSGVFHVHPQHSPSVTKYILPRATSCKQDLTKIDNMLTEELQRLQTEAMILSHQCESNSRKLQEYKCRIDETWSLARDEAANCKAAKDVIKVLTNQVQMNAVSEKFSVGRDMNNVRSSKANVYTPRPVQRESSGPEDAKSRDLYIRINGLRYQPMPSSDAVTGANGTTKYHSGTRSSGGTNDDAVTGANGTEFHGGTRSSDGTNETETSREEHAPKPSKDEWVEQVERGVYITFTTFPSGQKGLERVRFSRKHFSAKEAERWWEENQTRIYRKYNIERIIAAAKDTRSN